MIGQPPRMPREQKNNARSKPGEKPNYCSSWDKPEMTCKRPSRRLPKHKPALKPPEHTCATWKQRCRRCMPHKGKYSLKCPMRTMDNLKMLRPTRLAPRSQQRVPPIVL